MHTYIYIYTWPLLKIHLSWSVAARALAHLFMRPPHGYHYVYLDASRTSCSWFSSCINYFVPQYARRRLHQPQIIEPALFLPRSHFVSPSSALSNEIATSTTVAHLMILLLNQPVFITVFSPLFYTTPTIHFSFTFICHCMTLISGH